MASAGNQKEHYIFACWGSPVLTHIQYPFSQRFEQLRVSSPPPPRHEGDLLLVSLHHQKWDTEPEKSTSPAARHIPRLPAHVLQELQIPRVAVRRREAEDLCKHGKLGPGNSKLRQSGYLPLTACQCKKEPSQQAMEDPFSEQANTRRFELPTDSSEIPTRFFRPLLFCVALISMAGVSPP